MNKIKITYYRFKNDAKTAFNNVLKYVIDDYKEKDFDEYAEEHFDFKEFQTFYNEKIALVEIGEDIEYLCFTCKNKIFYNIKNNDLCFTNFADVDFESIDSYLKGAKQLLRDYKEDFIHLPNEIIFYLAVSREEYEKCGDEIIPYEIEDIEEY